MPNVAEKCAKCISGFTCTEVMAQQKLGQIFVQSETFSVKAQHFIQSNNLKKKSLYVTAYCSLNESAGRLKTATCQVCWAAQPQGGDYRKANDCPRRIRR